jgi:hypothetical protein
MATEKVQVRETMVVEQTKAPRWVRLESAAASHESDFVSVLVQAGLLRPGQPVLVSVEVIP